MADARRPHACRAEPGLFRCRASCATGRSPCCCPATTRRPPSRRWSRASARALPGAAIYVYDNNSTDGTRARSRRAAGAIVRFEPYQGKGNVVRRMFADIDADIYVLADGDCTYDAAQPAA